MVSLIKKLEKKKCFQDSCAGLNLSAEYDSAWSYRLFGAVPGTLNEVTGAAAPTPSYEFPNQTEIKTLANPAPAPQQPNANCPLILCKVELFLAYQPLHPIFQK